MAFWPSFCVSLFMTLRELLKKCGYRPVFNILYRDYLKSFKEDRIIEKDIKLRKKIEGLLSLDLDKNPKHEIYLTNAGKGIDICLLNKEQDELLDIGLVEINTLIDSEVVKAIKIDDDKELAAIIIRKLMKELFEE